MMKILFILIIVFCCRFCFGQKMAVDYFEEGVEFMDDNDSKKAITSFKYIVDNYPKNELYSKSYYNLGYIYFQRKDYKNAKIIFNSILNSQFNEKEKLGGGIMADPYANYRHRASNILSKIYYETKDYDSSLYYMTLSDTVYPYLHFCGNEYAANDVRTSLRYADIYEKLKDINKSKQALLKSVFVELSDNSQVLHELNRLFQKDKKKKLLIKELDTALENIYSKTEIRDDEEYTWHFFKFQKTEISIPYSFYKRDTYSEIETIVKIKETDFYKMVKKL